jgi:hypothetical protein
LDDFINVLPDVFGLLGSQRELPGDSEVEVVRVLGRHLLSGGITTT